MEEKYRRKRPAGMTIVEAQSEAHKIAFYPMLFQAVRSLINFGVLEAVVERKKNGASLPELARLCSISDYAAALLLDIAVHADIMLLENGLYKPTKLGECLLEDKSVRANMDFMHDVCYQGAFYLEESFKSGKPEGLRVFGDWNTVYQGLSQLPPKAHESWFKFDNLYSDLAFEQAAKIVLAGSPALVYDIGGNTARFDLTILNADPDVKVRIFDLEQQLPKARQTLEKAGLMHRAELHPVNMLDSETQIPPGADAMWMSQFLDCFSPGEIMGILQKLAGAMGENTRLFILEPFIDKQNRAAALSLLNTSLYFTCIANGNSRMYHQCDMLEFLERAGLKLHKAHQGIGRFNYTLLECTKP